MYGDISKPPPPLPSPQLKEVGPGLSLLPPLSRRGHGPGLIILVPDTADQQLSIIEGVPSALLKWAEEGYTVVEIQHRALTNPDTALSQAIDALSQCDKCDESKKIGLVVYDPQLWNQVAPALTSRPEIVGAVLYANSSDKANLATVNIPVVHHLAGRQTEKLERSDSLTAYHYATVNSHKFATPFNEDFHYSQEGVSHTRSLTFLKKHMQGPFFDLEAIWEEHTYYEFADRSVEWTMSTMVQEPYVNHVPTMTGGIGRGPLSRFYRDNFIFNNSADTELELISRTIGIDRVIDEFIFKFTHDQEIDWLLPGVPPTGLKAAIPFNAVVNIRGDRLYHEHIAWDQATALRQLGLLPEYLPYPYPLPDGRTAAPGKTFEYRVPASGIDTAEKMRDRNSVASNQMFQYKVREV